MPFIELQKGKLGFSKTGLPLGEAKLGEEELGTASAHNTVYGKKVTPPVYEVTFGGESPTSTHGSFFDIFTGNVNFSSSLSGQAHGFSIFAARGHFGFSRESLPLGEAKLGEERLGITPNHTVAISVKPEPETGFFEFIGKLPLYAGREPARATLGYLAFTSGSITSSPYVLETEDLHDDPVEV